MRIWDPMPFFRYTALRACSILVMAALSCATQSSQPVPVFTRGGIGAAGRNANVLAPGMVLSLYGGNLASKPVCGQPAVQPALELCGVRVLTGTTPAELLYVSSGQINFRIPADAPTETFAPLRVCVGAVCSAPVSIWFSLRTALLSLEKPAYVHMPVWIHIDPPPPYFVSYPCWNGPWIPSAYEFQVRRDGNTLTPIRQPSRPANWASPDPCDAVALGSRSSLPLHLLYKFDEPGNYSVRFTANKDGQVLYRSEWTDIVVEPFSEKERESWLRSVDSEMKMNSRSVVSNGIPSLLAWPDQTALGVLLQIIPANATQCANFDCIKLGFGIAALRWFDDALLRTQVYPERLVALCPPEGSCK